MMKANREEILISRASDGTASPRDWDELESLAAHRPEVWRDLAWALHDRALLQRGVDEALEVVARVEAPAPRLRVRRSRLGGWSGWAAAAVLALLWTRSAGLLSEPPGAELNQAAAIPAALGADEALARYRQTARESGRLVEEPPLQMLRALPLADGPGYDVLYVRRIIERAHVERLFDLERDENGMPVPVPATIAQPAVYRPL